MFGSGNTMWIILLVVVVIVIGFIIVSTITGKKAEKKEKAKRQKVVKNEIKTYLQKERNTKNIAVEYEKVYARKGPEFKLRDVFDVIVSIIEPKTQKVIERKAFEVEGITKKIDKKNFKTSWIVNGETDLLETERKIEIAEKKIKLTPEEKKQIRENEKINAKELREKAKEDYKKSKAARKNPIDSKEMEQIIKKSTVKFVPTRKK